MKKILIGCLIILLVFLIYLCNMDRKVYYLTLGDPISSGKNYSFYIKNYFKEKKVLEKYVDGFAASNVRIYDLINDIEDNKKNMVYGKEITLQNALIKADLVTIYIDIDDVLQRIESAEVYDYIDNLTSDFEELLKLMREYCKEDIVFVGYYSVSESTDKVIEYLNKKYEEVCNDYNVSFVKTNDIFKENLNFLDYEGNITDDGNQAIAREVIATINKTVFNT